MELCSIQDAFPDIQKGTKAPPGCTDLKASKEERKAARRKAKKCKGPAEEYLNMQDDIPTDPDRPAVKRMGELPAFVRYEDAYVDLSGGKFEGFKMPVLPAANCLGTDAGFPSYFGKGLEDGADEVPPINWSADSSTTEQQGIILADRDKLEKLNAQLSGLGSGEANWLENRGNDSSGDEGFRGMFNDSAATVLNETFEYEFGGKGAEKAGAVKTLPAPSLDDAWKPLTTAKTTTAFFTGENLIPKPTPKAQPTPKPTPKTEPTPKEDPKTKWNNAVASGSNPDESRDQMAKQMRELMKKFEELENRQKRDTKNELLLFVGTGLFVLVSLDIVARLSRR
jgi:hypothetical protein